MKAGKLAHVITVQRMTSTVDEYGGIVEDWTDHATLRAEIVEQSTEEFIRNYGAADTEILAFRTRYLADITNTDRIAFDGEFYNLKDIVKIGRRKGLELRAERVS